MSPMKLDDQGGEIVYEAGYLKPHVATTLFNWCRDKVPWRQEKGRYAPFPRLTFWYADAGLSYTYSGVTHQAVEFPRVLQLVREGITKYTGVPYNSLLLNYYRDGKDSIGFHTDAEPELGDNPSIGSISLGATRRFIMRHMKTKEDRHYDLHHGDLIVMQGTSQHNWLHGVPKCKEDAVIGGRINLTFRYIKK